MAWVLPTADQRNFNKKNSAFVSIIISAKNEEANIERCVSQILDQKYDFFELIVVNDYSTDGTAAILARLQDTHNKLVIMKPTQDLPGKKLAITEAIEKAKGDFILLTDADCQPSSPHWVSSMISQTTKGKAIVLGYGPMERESNWVNTFSRFETLLTALQYMSYARLGRPYMGVGRNMMFDKQLFIDNNGYQSHRQHASGDDDLFIQEVATSDNTTTCLHSDSFMYSPSESTVASYIRQKKRHLNSSVEYKLLDKILLSIYPFCILSIYLLFIALVGTSYGVSIAVVICLRWILMMIFLAKPAQRLKSLDLIWKYPLLEILHVIYLIYFASTAFNSKKHNWNG